MDAAPLTDSAIRARQLSACLALALILGACHNVSPTAPGSARESTHGSATASPDALPSVAEHVRGLRHFEGFLDVYLDEGRGALYLELPSAGQELLYFIALRAGLGSNDVGLDRGQLGARWYTVFRRAGRRALLVAPNLNWRSSSPNPIRERAVEEAFAESVLFGFDVVAEEEGRVLVDATDFFHRDAHGIARTLRTRGQGDFKLDRSRSILEPERFSNFPENTQIEVLQTFSSDAPGREVRSAAADATSVSFHVRHAFVALPELGANGYRPRAFDPRSGYFPISWTDVSQALEADLVERVIARHHLTRSRPIVYYIDRAAPPRVHQALLDGARYWVPVFEAAGFPGGFRVEPMPPGMDPADVRHNVVQWVDRSTRGWSYGDTITDPRTGEILKGHVTLGALRVRQDILLMQGLLGGRVGTGLGQDPRIVETALARIRQLAAHEVGHTLGLAHNFAASMDDRASVMDYPAPWVRVSADGTLDVADAYRDGCGEWDELAIRYGYRAFETDVEDDGLADCIEEMRERGLSYVSDADARGTGRSHPRANLWDNGTDALDALREIYRVRRIALEGLSIEALAPGTPLAELERVFVPVYLHHRYQLEAAVRLIGGLDYEYALTGAAQAGGVTVVPAQRQRSALELAIESLSPEFLRYRSELAAGFLAPPPGHERGRESFQPGARSFDALAPVRASIEWTLQLLLNSERAGRLVRQHDLDSSALSLEEVLAGLSEVALQADGAIPRGRREAASDEAMRFEAEALLLKHLIALAEDERADASVRRVVWSLLACWHGGAATPALSAWNQELLRRYFENPHEVPAARAASTIPPGSPIGSPIGSPGAWAACRWE